MYNMDFNVKDKKRYYKLIDLLISPISKSENFNKFQNSQGKINKLCYQMIHYDKNIPYTIMYQCVNKEVKKENITDDDLFHIPRYVENEKLKLIKVNDTITNSQITEFRDELMANLRTAVFQIHVNNIIQSLRNMKNSIYSDLVAILGIFVAIMAATFGGLQLFGSVFRHVDELSYVSFGRTVSLGSVILFGIYLILILLFNGIARLMHHDKYHFSPVFNMYLIFSFIIIFLLGFICSYPQVTNMYFEHPVYLLIMLSIIFVLIIIIWIAWKNPKCFIWHRKNDSFKNSDNN